MRIHPRIPSRAEFGCCLVELIFYVQSIRNLELSISDLSCNCDLSNVQIADMFHVDSFDLIEPDQYISFDVRKLSMRPGNAGPFIPNGGGYGFRFDAL